MLLLAAVLPTAGLPYALGLLLIRRLNLTTLSKIGGFLIALFAAAIAALLLAAAPTARAAMDVVVPAGLIGSVLAVGFVAFVGRREPIPNPKADLNRSDAPPKETRREKWRWQILHYVDRVKRLTKAQLIALVAAVAVTLTILFPPFVFDRGDATQNLGYGFLFSPPEVVYGRDIYGTVNVSLLIAEWIAIVVISILVAVFVHPQSLPGNRSDNENSESDGSG
jgi:hypothetical protein